MEVLVSGVSWSNERVSCCAMRRPTSAVLAVKVAVGGLMDMVVDKATAGTSNGEQSLFCTSYGGNSGYRWCERCEAYHAGVCPVAHGWALVGGASVHELP